MIRYYVRRLNDKIVGKVFRLCLKTLVFVHRYAKLSYFSLQLGDYKPTKTTIAVIAENRQQFRYFLKETSTPEKFTHIVSGLDTSGARFSEYLIIGNVKNATYSKKIRELTPFIKANIVRCH